MRNYFVFFLVCALTLTGLPEWAKGATTAKKSITIAVIDTTDQYDQVYLPLLTGCNQVDITLDYRGIDRLIDWQPSANELALYDGFWFILGRDTLQGIMHHAPLALHILTLIERVKNLANKQLGFFVPSLPGPAAAALMPLWRLLDLVPNQTMSNVPMPLMLLQQFCAHPPEVQPMTYHTTLSTPHQGASMLTNPDVQAWLKQPSDGLYLLPLVLKTSDTTKQRLPLGCYLYRKATKNHLFVSHLSSITSAGIAENFHITPAHPGLRAEHQVALTRMLFELRYLTDQQTEPKSPQVSAWCLKHAQEPLRKGDHTQIQQAKRCLKSAWMETGIFEDQLGGPFAKTPQAVQATVQQAKRQDLINAMLDANLDHAWLSISPNLHYSPIGRLKDKKETLWRSLGRFISLLKTTAQQKEQAIPELLIGFEIANNLYAPNLPNQFAYDLYDNRYYDIPAPLNSDFWTNEVIVPLQKFAADWQRPEVGNGIPLGGIVIDFEMYCRKQTGMFSSAMGFDAATFKRFCKAKNLKDPGSMQKRIELLTGKQLGTTYFAWLEEEAYKLGKQIAQACRTVIPHGTIMCYAPYIPATWFYIGLFRGLCSNNKAIHLMTFNSQWQQHQAWLAKKGITATHACVLMLSKIKSPEDYYWLDAAAYGHDGIWLNRFSRFIEPKATDWTAIEQPGLAETQYQELLENIGNFGTSKNTILSPKL